MPLLKMSINGHTEIAGKLKEMNSEFNKILINLSKYYGVNSKEVRYVIHSKEQINRLRSLLDSDVILENPNLPFQEINFYFGA